MVSPKESPSKLRKRNKEQDPSKENTHSNIQNKENHVEGCPRNQQFRYGPMPRFSAQRLWSKGVVILGVLIYVWYFSKDGKESVLAKQDQTYIGRGQHVDCNKDFIDEISQYPGCVPKKCGRYVSDRIVTSHEADMLLWLAKRGMALGGSSGGATILDLHSGALSFGEKFINVYNTRSKVPFITQSDVALYKIVRNKIQHAIAESFSLDVESLFLTHPTFFSRLTNVEPKTTHDEYWHVHVDKHTYESFHYTSLLYLNDFGVDFKGGRFIYLDDAHDPRKNVTVEPKKGRLSMFTSGAENPHHVERVTYGERYAITVSFTCDKSKAIADPKIKD